MCFLSFRRLLTFIVVVMVTATTVAASDVKSGKSDCDTLLGAVMPFAEQMLKAHGEFFPFGAAMQSDGKVAAVGAWDGDEHPNSTDVITLLKDGFVAGARKGEYKATALVYDVWYKSDDGSLTDAIAVALDHRDNYSVVVFYPYTLKDGLLSVGKIQVHDGAYEVFGR